MLKINGETIVTEKYPNKEIKVKDFISSLNFNECLLELKYESNEDLIALMFAKKRLDELGKNVKLFIWYMPYSRMDRKISDDLFTLKYICEFISSLDFAEIIVMEPHSNSTIDLLKKYGSNVTDIYPTKEWLYKVMSEIGFSEFDHIVFPDKGAMERYSDLDILNPLTFEKKRNLKTGKIESIELSEGTINLGSNCIIIDDLCSKGGTFMRVGGILKEKGAKSVNLLVAHCENTVFKGRLLNEDSPIDMIYTSDSILSIDSPKIKKMKLEVGKYGN